MDGSNQQRHRRFPRPRLGSRARSRANTASNMVELETLSAFSALERRAVSLSQDEAQVCVRLAELMLADTLKAYEGRSVIGRGQPQVDLQQWKLIKKKDQLCVYKQKKEAAKLIAAGQQQLGQCTASETDLPLLMVTGSVAGHVNDAMYGLVSATTRAMKMNSAYAEDVLEDAEVLATIEGPSIEEPFRFLGLKWAVRRDAMAKRRDLLYLEATGITKLANGDRVGYRVMHSVSIKALALLATTSISSSVIRARTSIVQLFHQQPSSEGSTGLTGTLNVFTRGYYDPQGGMMQFMAVNAGAELLLHMTFSVVDCAHLKKIAFAAQQAGRRRRASQLNKTAYGDGGMLGIEELCDEDTDAILSDGAWSTNCSLCDRRVGHLLNRSGVPCTICAKMVCSRCSVVKKLRFLRSEDSNLPLNHGVNLGGTMGVHDFERPEASRASTERSRSRSSSGSGANNMNDICQKALKFCLPCVLRANQRNASQIVVEEILEQTSFGLVTPRSTIDRPSNRSRPSSMRRRSTQTGRPYNFRSSQASNGSQQFSHYAASPYYQPRQKAYSSAAYVQPALHRSSSATPRVMLYVEDPATSSSGYSAA
ncbi:hypothetical protein L914_00491 [Phytophthora nicotianae]|uniref:FYVE-type domain-containing protein n=1 Tax=Phytophthora nicotianae TaxID=4792 RepID=W2P6C2_PHYNI|nr:hypothetical protein L914_00491 [Phytophthora nicotianae]